MTCVLTEKNGVSDWCEHHQMQHRGHYRTYALDTGEKGERFRKAWDIQAGHALPKPPTKHLRALPLAKQCIHFGPVLTAEEVKEKQLAGCRSCTGKIHVHHCTFPGKKAFLDGPYTRGAECMQCHDWKRKQDNLHQSPPPGSEPFPEKQPVTVKMLFTFGDTTIERTMTGIINDLLAIWSSRDNMSWFNVSLMHNEGPVKHYRFAVEYFAEGRRLFHIYSARLKLLSIAPFYAMAGGIFMPDEKTATADIPAMVGQKWAVSIAEVKHDPS